MKKSLWPCGFFKKGHLKTDLKIKCVIDMSKAIPSIPIEKIYQSKLSGDFK